ncbi:MAG TPA: ATP-binding protein [Povalibacter sp.]|nr:ATP-binding protein [Povalibacter sp.]
MIGLTAVFLILTGVCWYAALVHLVAGLRHAFNRLHLLFALLALLIGVVTLEQVFLHRASTAVEYVEAARAMVRVGSVIYALLAWFAFVYTSAIGRAVPLALTIAYAAMMVVNELQPAGLLFAELPRLAPLTLPWGEQVASLAEPQFSRAAIVYWLLHLANFGYILFQCRQQYRRGQHSQAIALGISTALLLLTVVVNVLITAAGLHSVYATSFGFVAMVMLMVLYLSGEESYQTVVAQASDGIFLATNGGRCIEANAAAARMVGYSQSELVGMNVADLIVLRERRRLEPDIAALAAGGALRRQVTLRRKDGSECVADLSVRALSDGRFLGLARDVTEQNRIYAALLSLAETAPVADNIDFMRRCARGIAEMFDRRFALIGLTNADGSRIRTLAVWDGDQHAEDFEYPVADTPCAELRNERQRLIGTGAWQSYPNSGWLAQRHFETYFGAALLGADGRKIGVIAVCDTRPTPVEPECRPILGVFASRISAELDRASVHAELRRLTTTLEARVAARTAELADLNKELEAYSYSVSHDLRAPVRAIAGFSGILLNEHDTELDQVCRKYLERIHASAGHMNSLIDGMLLLSRVSHQSLRREPVDLTAIAQHEIGLLHEREPARTVEAICTPGLVENGDARLLTILLHNLLENAWKYTARAEHAAIEFSREPPASQCVYYVRDNGVGFDMDSAARLFEPFQRLHSQAEFSGTGIGLATVARIVQRHGGRIWAQAEKGHGATFYFTLGQQSADESTAHDVS